MVRKGSWKTESKKDPRFNLTGRGQVGGFSMPFGAKYAIGRKAAELGVLPPDDLVWSYSKD